tara:strand:- start:115447 stop:117150 length:1704 start_codon:yes stop_codon:yes gene_type:complete
MIGCILIAPPLLADGFQSVGKQLFEKDWVFEELPQQPETSKVEATTSEFANSISIRRGATSSAVTPSSLEETRPGDGLGPMHNATSCAACHVDGGAAGTEHNVTLLTIDPRLSFFRPLRQQSTLDREEATKAARGSLEELFPTLILRDGTVAMDLVVHDKSTRSFYDPIRNELARHVPFGIKDEWFQGAQRTSDAIANQPVIAGRHGEIDFYLSQRNSPPLYGLGVIDRIEPSKLIRLARAQKQLGGDGVVGRLGVGKFGWRAQTPSLRQFIRNACAGELGLQTRGAQQPADVADTSYQNTGIDMTEGQVEELSRFVSSLPMPRQVVSLEHDRTAVREGQRVFNAIGCATCHVKNVEPAQGIYSDLLLHDMGELLQAPSPAPLSKDMGGVPLLRPVFFPDATQPSRLSRSRSRFPPSWSGYYGPPSDALPMPYPFARPRDPLFPRGRLPQEMLSTSDQHLFSWDRLQREWRTPPLWGVADSGPYLHDGRAQTLDAAIRWHGGEAKQSTTKYRSLDIKQQKSVVQFLSTLRAPHPSKPVPGIVMRHSSDMALHSGDVAMAKRISAREH